jgi:hypothetical protein
VKEKKPRTPRPARKKVEKPEAKSTHDEVLPSETVEFMREFIEETETWFMQDETCYVHYKEMQRTDN